MFDFFKRKAGKREKPLILHADDEPLGRALVSAMLSEEGMEVLSASDGAEAVKLAAKRLPDLILLDVQMPGMDGIEACHNIRQNPKTALIPILMLTALDRMKDMEKALAWGANGYLVKPVDADKLNRAVAKALPLPRGEGSR